MAQTGSIEFWNVSEGEVSVYRLRDGSEQHVVDLAPDASSVQATFAGEKWLARDKATGVELGSVTGTAGQQLYEIKKKGGKGKEGPQKSGS